MTAARFTGKSVLVTGASRGLGRDIAIAFAREGARVGIAFRSRRDEAEVTLTAVRDAGGSGELLSFDVRDAGAVDTAVTAFAANGGLDVVVNNAATLRDQLLMLMSPDDWNDVLAVNLTGAFHVSKAAVRCMLAAKSGAIINVASIAAVRASTGQANYAASKGGMVAMSQTLAAELAPRGIRVNVVVPGMLTTGMGQRLDHRAAARYREAIPLARFGEADEVARAVVFLASNDASYIIGQQLIVDGGLSL